MRRYLLTWAPFVSVCLTLSAPGVLADSKALLDGIVAGHIVPRYQKLESATADLSQAIAGDCGDGTLGDAGSKAAFKSALVAWHSIQHIRFGPIMVDDRHYKFEYWPDKHGQGARQLRKLLAGGVANIPSAARIGDGSVAVQGFSALERIIDDTTSDSKTRCALAVSISANLKVMSAATARGWTSWQFGPASDGGQLLARQLSDQLGLMAELKLARPLGENLETARPRRAEHWRSSLSYAALSANFDGLYGLFAGENGRPGLRRLMLAGGGPARQADQLAEHLKYGVTFIDWQKMPLHEAVSVPKARDQAVFLLKHVRYTQELVKSVVYPALGVAAGFNSQDGD